MPTPDDERKRIDEILAEVARQAGGTLHPYPRPGERVRRIVLRDVHDERGTQYEEAVLELDGTVRVTGADHGPGVSSVFGEHITSYEWVFVIAPDRVADLVAALGGTRDDDVLTLLAAYHERVNGRISGLMRGSAVGAEFSNWHS